MKYRLLLLLTTPWLFGVSVVAQETTGNLEGWVFDGKGDPIIGANVAVTSIVLQGTRGSVTDERGYFRIPALPPGSYTVKIGHISFQPATINNVRAFLGRTTNIGELRLQSRDLSSAEVVITGARPLIDPRSTTAGINLTDDRFEELPVDRSYMSMLQLAPQSSPSFYGDGTNIAGATGIENRYFIDGSEGTDAFRGVSGTQLPYNFIREVQVRSDAYEAEYQSSLGGIVNVVTYSGGNEIHGQAFGFFTNNRFSGSPRLALGPVPKGKFSEYDVGLSIGGPIAKDKLWYFLAYNPRFVKEVVPVTGQLDQNDRATTHMFATKLTWTANESNMLTLSVNGDPTTRQGVGVNLMGDIYPYQVLDLNAWLTDIHAGSTSIALTGTHMIGPALMLESSLSLTERKDEYNPVDRSGLYYVDYSTSSVGGTFNRTFEKTSHFHAGIRGTVTLATHTIKAGIEYSGLFYNSEDTWQALSKFSDSLYMYSLRNFAGKVASRNPSVFLQDSWQVSERFTLSAGIRWDPQFMIASDGTVSQEIMGGVGPRVGLIIQPGNIGSERITVSLGRFYQPIHLNLPSSYHIKSIVTYDVYYPQDPRVDTSGASRSLNLFSFYGNVQGLMGQYYDEITVGYEREILARMKVGARIVYRTLGQAIEDGYSTRASRLVYGNPGSPPLEEYPKAKREHISTELTVEYVSSTGFSFQASYVLSRNYGNFEGLADATYSSATGGIELWPNTSLAFTVPQMMNNALGLLPNDRTHAFKFFGSYSFALGLTVGTSGFWTSGTPLNELGYTPPPLALPAFLLKRGSVGRAPSIWDLNLRLAYDLASVIQTSWHPRLIVDVLHLFSQKKAVQIDQQHYLAADANGNQYAPNPNYGTPIQFQPPMSVRLGMEVNF